MDPAYKQDWYYDEDTGEIRRRGENTWIDFADEEDAAKLAAAAPKMARAILAGLNGVRGWQKLIRDAAVEAGLPIPEE